MKMLAALILFCLATLAAACGRDTSDPAVQELRSASTSSVTLPANVQAWWDALAPASSSIVSFGHTDLTYIQNGVWKVKGVAMPAEQPFQLCFDDSGATLSDCGGALAEANAQQRRLLNGALDDELVAALNGIASDALTPVGIWLRTYYDPPPREAQIGLDVQTANAPLLAAVQSARTTFLAALPAALATRIQFVPEAPAAYGSLSVADIRTIGALDQVASISLQKGYVPASTAYVGAVNANATGYSGAGIDVCMIEVDQLNSPTNVSVASTYCGGGTQGDHGRQTAGIVHDNGSPYGDATGATIHVASWDGCDPNATGAYAWCADNGYPVWNFSHTTSALDNALFDYWSINAPYPTIAIAAGNGGVAEQACGVGCSYNSTAVSTTAYNALIVGASNDCGTTARSDDAIACFSNGVNPVYDRELPMLVAPGQDTTSDEGNVVSGTSFAAPAVASGAAQLMQLNSTLVDWPEAIRSILMTGADEELEGGPINLNTPATDYFGGVGELNILTAVQVGASANRWNGTAVAQGYDFGTITQSSTPVNTWYGTTYLAESSSGGRLRAVLTWDSSVTCSNVGSPTSVSCGTPTINGDFDMYIYRVSDGHLMVESASNIDNYEAAEVNVAANTEYAIMFYPSGWNSSWTYFGISWNIGTYGVSSD